MKCSGCGAVRANEPSDFWVGTCHNDGIPCAAGGHWELSVAPWDQPIPNDPDQSLEPWRRDAKQLERIIEALKIELRALRDSGRYKDRIEPNPLSWVEGEQVIIKLINYWKCRVQRATLDLNVIAPGFDTTIVEVLRTRIKQHTDKLDEALRFYLGFMNEWKLASNGHDHYARGCTSIEFTE